MEILTDVTLSKLLANCEKYENYVAIHLFRHYNHLNFVYKIVVLYLNLFITYDINKFNRT